MILDILAWGFLGLCAAVVLGTFIYAAIKDEFVRFCFVGIFVMVLVILAVNRVS